MINIKPEHLEIVKTILANHVPEAEVRAFGSRVTRTAKDYSDLDLAIIADHKLDIRTLALLKLDFEESDLPFRVDILDWHTASDEFQKMIEKEYEIIYPFPQAKGNRN